MSEKLLSLFGFKTYDKEKVSILRSDREWNNTVYYRSASKHYVTLLVFQTIKYLHKIILYSDNKPINYFTVPGEKLGKGIILKTGKQEES